MVISVLAPWFALLLVAAALGGDTTGHLDRQIVQVLLLAAAVAAPIFAWVRLARTGVEIAPEGVRVVNPFSTRTFTWNEIERFDYEGSFARLRLSSGRRVRCFGISGPNFFVRDPAKRAEGLVAELNAEVEQRNTFVPGDS
jgi:hypothetical protein